MKKIVTYCFKLGSFVALLCIMIFFVFPVHAYVPSRPEWLYYECDTDAGIAYMNWQQLSTYTEFAFRLDNVKNGWNDSCTDLQEGDSCWSPLTRGVTVPVTINDQYRFWVHAIYNGQYSQSSDVISFSCKQPRAHSFYYDCTENDTKARLSWRIESSPDRYELRFDRDPDSWSDDCTNPTAGDMCLTSTTNSIEVPLEPNKEYRSWLHEVQNGVWSSPATAGPVLLCGEKATPTPIDTPVPIPGPELNAPRCLPGDTSNTETLSWKAHVVSGKTVSRYNIQVINPLGVIHFETFTLPSLLSTTPRVSRGVVYDWQVRTFFTDGQVSEFSKGISFSCPTTPPPSTPTATPTETLTPLPTNTATPTAIPTDIPLSPSETQTPISLTTTLDPDSEISPTQTPDPEPPDDCPDFEKGNATCDFTESNGVRTGIIDLSDYVCWFQEYVRQNLPEVCRSTNFDESADGVSLLDYVVWQIHYLKSIP